MPRRAAARPRPAPLRHLRRGGWLVLVLLLVAARLSVLWWEEHGIARALADHGVEVTATVVDTDIESHRLRSGHGPGLRGGRLTEHLVTYAWRAPAPGGGPSVEWRAEHAVPKALHDALAVGDAATLRILPEDPAQSEAVPGQRAAEARKRGLLALGALALSALVAALREWRRGLGPSRRPATRRWSKGAVSVTMRLR